MGIDTSNHRIKTGLHGGRQFRPVSLLAFFCLWLVVAWMPGGGLYAQDDRVPLWDIDTPQDPMPIRRSVLPGSLNTDPDKPRQQLKPQPTAGGRTAPNSDADLISIDFNNIDINVFIKFISVVTGNNFVVDPAVQGKVTIISQDKVTGDEAYATFESVLEMHGFAAVKEGMVVKIVPWEKALTREDIEVYPLKHSSAADVAEIIRGLPRHNGKGASNNSLDGDKINISIDAATNSLIIAAKKHDHAIIGGIIDEIDAPLPMVYIEAVIMEVNMDKDLRLGTEWLAGTGTTIGGKNTIVGGGFSNGAGSNLIPPSGGGSSRPAALYPPGFSLGVFSQAININGVAFPSLSVMVQAFKQDRDVNILSIPQIMTTDNQEASVVVGRNVPFQTQTTTSENNTFNSFEYRDVGNILKIKPHITRDRLVRMDIALELSALEEVPGSQPITTKRSVDTSVVVKDRNTIVIAGLIDDNTVSRQRKVPCLGDIPLIGWLARNDGSTQRKTNLYVFLKPRVVYNDQEAHDIYTEKKAHFK